MMNLAKLLPKKSKQGVTLVEVVFGVVVLSIIAVGIIAALSTGSTTIHKKAQESASHSEAVQKMDAVISVISNGSYAGTDVAASAKSVLGYGSDVTLTATAESYTNAAGETKVRGWKLSLTYKGETVTGYASNTEGVFDKDE
ncbi:MAG: hypothetical protein E7286_02175 [Lachnospiraceae bacterium]|nr:hypothetical protein [Lachnospiraceae bacterium]